MPAASITRLRALTAAAALLLLPAAGAAADPSGGVSPPLASPPAVTRVDFERHVMGLFGRLGCNAGSCHGSFQGKGGFRLSLFGYDPARDYLALTREALGRRVNPADPDASLVLLKATAQVAHGGGRRFARDSWPYQLLRDWVAAGTPWRPGSGDVADLLVTPAEPAFARPGETARLAVRARFADGTEEDVTPFCDFRSGDDAVAEVTAAGGVRGLRPGDAAVVVSYRGHVRAVRVLVPRPAPPGFRYPAVPEVNFIDREVFAKLRRLNVVPSELSGDAEFLRRVTIDTVGSLPAPDEVRAFLADRDPDKRAKKIDALLAHPRHAALGATKFCDVTGNNTDRLEQPVQLRVKRSQMWHDWFRKRLAENMPYDEIVRGVLCATSRDGLTPEAWIKQVRAIDEAAEKGFDSPYADRPSLDLFWRRQQPVPIQQWGEKVAAAFLGVRLECAQCHKHPFDRWTQADYRAFANVFGAVAFGASPEAKAVIDAENAARGKANKGKPANVVREVYVSAGPAGRAQAPLRHPDTGKPLPAKALGGPEIRPAPGEDPRVALFDWMRARDNPFFARSFVNRVWGHYLGVGLVDPVDNFSLANPPSNEKLLDALARDFIEHRYDVRHLERTILRSRTYQLSSATNEGNRLDRRNYAHGYVRPMMAEVVVDVLDTALGVDEELGKDAAPPHARAIEVGASRVPNANLAYAFRVFGRPPRASACDCDRAPEPALPQALFLMADPTVQAKLQAPGGRLRQLLDRPVGDGQVLEELFLATLGRPPTAHDRQVFAEHRKAARDRRQAFADTLWALINTREFILNH
jgi:hypothetical protein